MATEIKVPGVLTVGTGDHYGTTDGIKDIMQNKSQQELNAQFATATDVGEMTKAAFDALDDEGKAAAKDAHEWFILTE